MNKLEKVVQWYPGHMVRAMRRIGDYLKLIDIVVEVVDARVARSGRNPLLDRLIGERARLLVLGREDLADPAITKAWLATFDAAGRRALAADGRAARSVSRIAHAMAELAGNARGMSRAIIVGLPNSGKSSIINALLRRTAAKTEDRAGVTRQLQWFRLAPNIELMDTPGILVPKIADADAQWKLALTGAVPRAHYDPEEIVERFTRWNAHRDPESTIPDLQAYAAARGFMRKGGEADLHNAARSYVSTFNDGVFGRISLEAPGDGQAA
jgi:ribosome biogenesis GTPase A